METLNSVLTGVMNILTKIKSYIKDIINYLNPFDTIEIDDDGYIVDDDEESKDEISDDDIEKYSGE